MQNSTRLAALIEKFERGTATEAEILELNGWYHSFDDTKAEITREDTLTESEIRENIKAKIFTSIQIEQSKRVVLIRKNIRAIAAAAILIFFASGYIIINNYLKKDNELAQSPVKPIPNVIVPGGNKAQLTLADGSTIILDSASNGLLTTQGKIQVIKLDDGLLAYTINGKLVTEKDESFYNTISTPRGGQYQITLSDGTKVWLNAASSIRFPIYFSEKECRVEITGEAYFEVAKNAEKPFKVKAENSEIEVLGTHFNVNAYTDEANIRTTLLEGKVKVSSEKQTTLYLEPGQQSGIDKNGEIRVVKNADTDEAIAWLKGRFQFNSADLRSMLRQISRWYDVEVEYRGPVDLHFSGQLTRNEEVTKVFEKLQLTGEVHFNIEGRKVIVTR